MPHVHVPLDWHRIEWMPGDTWTQDIVPRLAKVGINQTQLRRCVYVIRLHGDFCIGYPKGSRPPSTSEKVGLDRE